jgi:hypothetical protein
MAKFCGMIGYEMTVETEPGIFEEQCVEHMCIGDVIKDTRRIQDAGKVNSDITINNQFSIIADPFANEHFHSMRYIVFMGVKWKITEVEVQYPRLILSVGGVYNV